MASDSPVLSDREQEVYGVLEACYEAWTANDADAFAEHYTKDTTSILPGSIRSSREEVRNFLAAGFATRLKGTSVLDELRSVRFVRDDVAILVTDSAIVPAGVSEAPAEDWVKATWVIVKEGDRWLIASYHNCALNV